MKLLSSQRFLLVYAGGPDSCIEQNEFFPMIADARTAKSFQPVGVGERRDYPMQEGCDASLRIAEPPGDQQDTEWATFWANHKGARSAFT